MQRIYCWDLPLPRTHTGILQGNGTMGTILWGGAGDLRLTIGRADFWDHRGGSQWTAEMSYENVRRHLEQGDEEALNDLFRSEASRPDQPDRPTVLPVGRVDLQWDLKVRLEEAELDLTDGTIGVRTAAGAEIRVLHAMDEPLVMVEIPPELADAKIRPVPAWEYVEEELSEVGFEPPQALSTGTIEGWLQRCPADPALCVGWARTGGVLAIATARGAGDEAPRRVDAIVTGALAEGFEATRQRCGVWWDSYWERAAEVELPNPDLQFLYDYGMYKFAGFTNPEGVAATLQGPWIEEYALPPWSSDYHFNVNVQMCYQPAYHGNLVEHLTPLWEMIGGWTETLRHNARMFLGIEDGLMLPHAVSDDCRFITGYWGHSVDHGCTAWVAQMMFRHYRYSQDEEFLEQTALPFMRGAMRVYEEMLQREDDGTLSLPVGISPEYFNSQGRGWGPDASFQLACIHRLCEDLLEACSVLGEEPKPAWEEISGKLPRACLIGEPGQERIALWAGQALEESHRHHSHLGAIAPFDLFDPRGEDWGAIVERSLREWILRGPGLWSGWCLSWASRINSRVGNPEAAEMWLEVFDRFFTNRGGGTLHDCRASGISLMGSPAVGGSANGADKMQMDGGMGSVGAIHEMLLHTRRGVNHLFEGAPGRWSEVSFDGILTDGAFLVGAARQNGRVGPVRVESKAGGRFRLANPWERAIIRRAGKEDSFDSSRVLEVEMEPKETVTIHPG